MSDVWTAVFITAGIVSLLDWGLYRARYALLRKIDAAQGRRAAALDVRTAQQEDFAALLHDVAQDQLARYEAQLSPCERRLLAQERFIRGG